MNYDSREDKRRRKGNHGDGQVVANQGAESERIESTNGCKVKRPGRPAGEEDSDVPLPKITRQQKMEGRFEAYVARSVGNELVQISTENDASTMRARPLHPVPSQGDETARGSTDPAPKCPGCTAEYRPLKYRKLRAGSGWRGIVDETMMCARCYVSYSLGR